MNSYKNIKEQVSFNLDTEQVDYAKGLAEPPQAGIKWNGQYGSKKKLRVCQSLFSNGLSVLVNFTF